jgi:hypothetical protein
VCVWACMCVRVCRGEIWSQFQFDSVKVGGEGGGDGGVAEAEEVVLGARQDKRRHFLAKSTRARAHPKKHILQGYQIGPK